MPDPLIGQTIGRYEIVDRIGQGGMGVVYRGRQMSLNRTVAIKFLPLQMAADQEFVGRFRQEAEVIAGLAHENIVYVYDIDEHQGTWYIVMEYIDGHSLRQLRGHQVFSADEVRALGIPLARALDYAHQRGIVHRDIKSANVMVTQEGKVKLMDFGIAKAQGSGVKTITGSVLGTPEYMSPEQARSGRVTPQSDVYSLGVLLYELSTGTLPFRAEDPFAVALKHVSEEPEPPSSRSDQVPPWLEEIILRAMAKDPGARYASAGDLEHDLLRAGADHVTDPTGMGLASESPTRNLVAAASAATAATAPVGAPPPTPTPARRPAATPPPAPPPTPTPRPAAFGATVADAGATPPPPPGPVPTTGTGPGVPAPTAAGIPPRWWGLGIVAVLALVLALWFLLRTGPEQRPTGTTASAGTAGSPELPAAVAPGGGPTVRVPPGPAEPPPELSPEQKARVEAGVLVDLAETRLAEGDYRKAFEHAEAALALVPDHVRAAEIRDAARAALEQQARPAPTPPPPTAPPPPPRVVQAPPPPAPVVPPAPVPPPPPTVSVPDLWRQARDQYDRHEFHSLRETLDRILAADPRHEDARDWREDADEWVADHEEEVREELDSWVVELADTIGDQDFGDIEVQWGHGKYLDSGTGKYFRDLFAAHPRIVAELSLRSASIRDNEARFVASVRIVGKGRRFRGSGEEELVLSQDWRGVFRLIDGDPVFVTPFP